MKKQKKIIPRLEFLKKKFYVSESILYRREDECASKSTLLLMSTESGEQFQINGLAAQFFLRLLSNPVPYDVLETMDLVGAGKQNFLRDAHDLLKHMVENQILFADSRTSRKSLAPSRDGTDFRNNDSLWPNGVS